MSDFVSGITWSFDPIVDYDTVPYRQRKEYREKLHFFPQPFFGSALEESVQKAVQSIGIEGEMDGTFLKTTPIWYGFWIQSPLNKNQCEILLKIFRFMKDEDEYYKEDYEDILHGLNRAVHEDLKFFVENQPPGHLDFGWHSIYVHCPRCKVEGPYDPYEDSYPLFPIDCLTCGECYIPSVTCSSERVYFCSYVICDVCDEAIALQDLHNKERNLLEDLHYYDYFCEELKMLLKVERFYGRKPECKGKIKTHLEAVLTSNDPEVLKKIIDVPLYEIKVPENTPKIGKENLTEEDKEVIDYLKHNFFDLKLRMEFVREKVDEYKSLVDSKKVSCPSCKRGELKPDEDELEEIL